MSSGKSRSSSTGSSTDRSSSTGSDNISSTGLGKKRKSENSENENTKKQKEEQEVCGVCQEELNDPSKPLKPLKQKMEHGNPVCGHIFHKDCVDSWFKYQKRQNEDPNCPICRKEIDQDELPLELRDRPLPPPPPPPPPQENLYPPTDPVLDLLSEQPQTQAVIRTSELVREQVLRNNFPNNYVDPLFMGIVVCINGQMLARYLNYHLNITLFSNVRSLKEALLNKSRELARMRGFFCLDNIFTGVNNIASITGLTQYRNHSFVIENMYFGTPSNCDNIYELNTGINLTDDEVLINVYKNYQRKINRYSDIVGDRVANSQNIKKVSIPVGSNNNYFLNDDNPNIPLPFQANADELTANQRIKSTVHSLCWVVVNIRCNTFQNNNTLVTHTLENRIGGRKTRNKNKKTKKSRGSKKTNRRRIK